MHTVSQLELWQERYRGMSLAMLQHAETTLTVHVSQHTGRVTHPSERWRIDATMDELTFVREQLGAAQ